MAELFGEILSVSNESILLIRFFIIELIWVNMQADRTRN